jgi:hypothetical protein
MAARLGRTNAAISESLHSPLPIAATVALLFVICLILRLPVRADYLVNWDAVQFALATEDFNLHQHRPHPPGYIGYVFAGDILNNVTGDPNTSFVIISLAASALAPALFWLLAVRMLSRRRAQVATALFATSPLLWYYGGVALTYSVEAAFAVGVGLMAWLGRQRGGRWMLAASLLLGITGAIRPTGEVLLLPLWLWMVWPAVPRMRFAAAGVLIGTSLAWIVPLFWLAGGAGQYFHETLALAESAGLSTSLLSGDVVSIAGNWAFLVVSLMALLGAALVPLAWNGGKLASFTSTMPDRERNFLLAWSVPALATFFLGHIGQAGYVLILTAPLFLFIARLDAPRALNTRTGLHVALGALVAINALIVFRLPQAIYSSLPPDTAAAAQARQFSPGQNDAHWQKLVEFVGRFDPDTTAILAASGGPNSGGSFREISYYLPDYYIYATFRDEQGFGVFYRSHAHHDDYQIARKYPSQLVPLPAQVTTVLVIDWHVMEDFHFTFPLTEFTLQGGPSIWLGRVEAGTALVFREPKSRIMAAAIGRALVEAIPPSRAYRSGMELAEPAP